MWDTSTLYSNDRETKTQQAHTPFHITYTKKYIYRICTISHKHFLLWHFRISTGWYFGGIFERYDNMGSHQFMAGTCTSGSSFRYKVTGTYCFFTLLFMEINICIFTLSNTTSSIMNFSKSLNHKYYERELMVIEYWVNWEHLRIEFSKKALSALPLN